MNYTPKQWITAMDLDFTAESNQTLSTDTTYTIGGKTWTKINSANDATAMAITNGTGLVIKPNSTSNLGAATFSGPTIMIPVTSVISSFNLFMPLRIWIYESASNEAANFDELLFGIWIYNASYTNQYTCAGFRGFNGGTNGWGSQVIVLKTNAVVTSGTTPSSANRVGVVYFPVGMFSGMYTVLAGTSVVSGAWPSFSNLDLSCSPVIPSATSATGANSSSGARTTSDMNFFITAIRAGSATSFSATIARFRVDYLPLNN